MVNIYFVLNAWELSTEIYHPQKLGSGLINHTWKISGPVDYILQEVNTVVFKNPKAISDNLEVLSSWLSVNYPGYLFIAPVKLPNGNSTLEYNGKIYRLFPFIKKSVTINIIDNAKQAYEAARQFGLFTSVLNDFDQSRLQYPLPDFHNLKLRIKQFETACLNANIKRLQQVGYQIAQIAEHIDIAITYQKLIENPAMFMRVIHHDTKISNVLFDKDDNGLCVIDLDTVMPGYFISDVGDMMRTYLSPVNEEETNFDKISINLKNFKAIYKGYMSAMNDVLTDTEKQYFIYSGKFLIYMQALRFLTDFLNGDVYYQTTYAGQNLNRTKNQLRLLTEYLKAEVEMKKIVFD